MTNNYELLYLASENDDEAFEKIYKKYSSTIYNKAKKYSGNNAQNLDDFINIGNLTFYNTIKKYKYGCSFNTYLNTCLKNSLQNYQKSLNRYKNKILDEALSLYEERSMVIDSIFDERYNPEKIILAEESYQVFRDKIIENLTWEEELVLTLKEQDYSPKEISQIIDNNLKSVYNIINKIQKKVSNIM